MVLIIICISNVIFFSQDKSYIVQDKIDSIHTVENNNKLHVNNGKEFNLDSLLIFNNSLNHLKVQLNSTDWTNYSEKESEVKNIQKNLNSILDRWKMLREKGLINNPMRNANEPNRSGIPLGNWWGFYAGLEQPPSDTLWGLSRMNLDSLLESKTIKFNN